MVIDCIGGKCGVESEAYQATRHYPLLHCVENGKKWVHQIFHMPTGMPSDITKSFFECENANIPTDIELA